MINDPIKRHRVVEWIKTRPICLQETHIRAEDTHRLKVKEWKTVHHANGNEKLARVAILISDKIEFKTKSITKAKEGNYIMIKGSIQEGDIMFINIYAPIIGASNYIKQILSDI